MPSSRFRMTLADRILKDLPCFEKSTDRRSYRLCSEKAGGRTTPEVRPALPPGATASVSSGAVCSIRPVDRRVRSADRRWMAFRCLLWKACSGRGYSVCWNYAIGSGIKFRDRSLRRADVSSLFSQSAQSLGCSTWWGLSGSGGASKWWLWPEISRIMARSPIHSMRALRVLRQPTLRYTRCCSLRACSRSGQPEHDFGSRRSAISS